MNQENSGTPPPGWVGGFAQSNPAFAYPNPDLSSLPMLDNMANINLLTRQQGVKWPEFSWLTKMGEESSRCYTMFAPYISRLGYDNTGRVYSIICPQQGMWLGDKLCLNVEVTVTGQRGWVDETNKELAADMTVEGKIWFTPSQHQGDKIKLLWPFLEMLEPDFPLNKEHAIKVKTYLPGDPSTPIFPLKKGVYKGFPIPEFALHHDEAWTVANLEVVIGDIDYKKDNQVNEFNELVMKAFNLASGNMLHPGNMLTWNVWFVPPAYVNRVEWRTHAKRWRDSIDEHHGSPTGEGTAPRYFDGTPYKSPIEEAENAFKHIEDYIHNLLGELKDKIGHVISKK